MPAITLPDRRPCLLLDAEVRKGGGGGSKPHAEKSGRGGGGLKTGVLQRSFMDDPLLKWHGMMRLNIIVSIYLSVHKSDV